MARRFVAAALVVAAAAGIVAAVSIGSSDPLAKATSLDEVVTQVRTNFGDDRIARAGVRGSTLDVTLAASSSNEPTLVKGAFEAHILAAAARSWAGTHGQEPIRAVRYADLRGAVLSGASPPLNGEPVPSNADVSALGPDACRAAAEASVKPPLTIASVAEFPYLHGTCVFRFRTVEPVAGSNEAMAVLGQLVRRLGDPNERPWYFELDGPQGEPLSAASWVPGVNGSTWARPGFAYALAHE